MQNFLIKCHMKLLTRYIKKKTKKNMKQNEIIKTQRNRYENVFQCRIQFKIASRVYKYIF